MTYQWEMDGLQFKKDIQEYFEAEDLNHIKSFNADNNDILYDDELLLKKVPLYIDDNRKIQDSTSIVSVYEYYSDKLLHQEKDEVSVFTYNINNNKFEKEDITFLDIQFNMDFIENINIRGVDSDLLNISPDIFHRLSSIYSEKNNEHNDISNFRNFHSALLLSDKVVIDVDKIILFYHDPENEKDKFKKISTNNIDYKINNAYFYIFKWINFENTNKELVNIKHKVAKIYISMFDDLNNSSTKKEEDIDKDLNILYDLTLQNKSKKYYEYNKLMKDHHISFLQQQMQIKTELNKRIMNMLTLIPIAIYGLYLTQGRFTAGLTIFSTSYNIVYFSFLLAIIFLFLSLKNNIKDLNGNYKIIMEETNNIYKLKHIDIKEEDKLSLKDFNYSIIWMSTLFIIILTIILVSNFDYLLNIIKYMKTNYDKYILEYFCIRFTSIICHNFGMY